MFARVARFAVERWSLVIALFVGLVAYGGHAFRSLPIEAFPDVTDPQIELVGIYPGEAAEEVEKRVTIELERVLAGTPHLVGLRSVSVFGLALLTLTFEETTSDLQNRASVTERLRDANLPDGASAVIGPQATPVGQIYRYTLRGNKSLRDLRAINEFVVEKRLRAVPGVADVVTFGGFQRQYQVRIDPVRLAAAGISIDQVHDAVARANANVGGGYVALGTQELVVRGIGATRAPTDLGLAVVAETDGVPIRVADVADVVEGSTPRRGSVGRGHEDEVVEGIVLLRRGENPSVVLAALRERITALDRDILPKGVRIDTFYDRTHLVDATLVTVLRNMVEGIALVVVVLYLFLRTFRAVVIVAVVIPVSLLSAFIGLHLLGLPANLISLGAIDFGILVDAAVIVVEATLHALAHDAGPNESKASVIERTAARVGRPVVFAMIVIVAALAPIFALQRTEGRIFAPMAYTYAFALGGALLSGMLLVPALSRVALPERTTTTEARWLAALRARYLAAYARVQRRRGLVFGAALAALFAGGLFARGIGTEFLPELDEGGLYVTTTFPSTISLDQTKAEAHVMRERILTVPEVVDVLSQIGRPESAPQAEGSFNVEFFVALAPESTWRAGYDRPRIETELREALATIPGAAHNFSQPITDRVFETLSGIIGQVVVKVHGDDLDQMTALAEAIIARLAKIDGITDLALYQAGELPQLRAEIDRDAIARRGLAVADVQQTLGVALGGTTATQIWDGEKRFDVALRLPDAYRRDVDLLGLVPIGAPERHVTLADVASIVHGRGRTSIWREDFARFVAVKFNVRGRDLGSTVRAAEDATADLPRPEGIYVTWGGEFQNQARAMRRLAFTLPLAVLAIAGILYATFRRLRPTLTILAVVPFALVAAVVGLRLAGENFSVSSAVGCVALIGQVVLAGVVVCSRIDERVENASIDRGSSVREGLAVAFRPVLATTTLALLGLAPAALSHAMGSETQRPFAIAVIAGLIVAIPTVLFLLPIAYTRDGAERSPEANMESA